MTVGQVPGSLGLQCCSLMSTGSRTRAHPASGNVHLGDWDVHFGSLRIWHSLSCTSLHETTFSVSDDHFLSISGSS